MRRRIAVDELGAHNFFEAWIRVALGCLGKQQRGRHPARDLDQLAIFNATPGGNGLSPMLKTVPSFSSSQVETFYLERPSFLDSSALVIFTRYLTLLPLLLVTDRTICFPSSVGTVCSAEICVERVVLFTVSI
jgi:hypothetical protein